MRVAVHFAEDHPLAQDEGPAVVAYKIGRIEEGVHNEPPGHFPIGLDQFLANVIAQAQAEYPGHEVTGETTVANRICVERLVDDGDGTGRWIPAEEFDPEQHTPVGPGSIVQRDVTAPLSGEAGS